MATKANACELLFNSEKIILSVGPEVKIKVKDKANILYTVKC